MKLILTRIPGIENSRWSLVRAEDLSAWLALEMLSGSVRWRTASQARTGVKGGNTFLLNTDKTLEKRVENIDEENWKCLGGS